MRALLTVAALVACGGPRTTTGEVACAQLLQCPAPVETECTGAQTTVEVAEASVCALASSADDRLTAYPLGETAITFESSQRAVGATVSETCATAVTVVDTTAPIVACDPSVLLVRTSPDEPYPAPPNGTAADQCDGAPTLTVSPTTLSAPLTDVTITATDASGNEASCVSQVEVLDVFAVPEFRLLGAQVVGGGTTGLTLGWELPDGDANQVLVERADGRDGPWTSVVAADVDDLLVTVEQTDGHWYRLTSLGSGAKGGSTEPLQVHHVVADSYRMNAIDVPTVPFRTTLYGIVRAPADLSQGPFPLVLIMHGNHGNCRRLGTVDDYCATLQTHDCDFSGFEAAPNAEGLAFLAESLAARGMIAATVSANALNCRSGYILERAQLLRSHLEWWSAWNGGESGPMETRYAGALDMRRVGLVGHSRGGDAVSQVPRALADAPLAGVDVTSIYAIAPTDYNDATVFDASYAVLLPACDGDVSSLWGADIYERSQDRVWHKSQVFFPGANHNFFNDEWFFDDGQRACAGGDRVGGRAQEAMLQDSVGSWMIRTLDGDRPHAVQRAERPAHEALQLWAGRRVDLRWAYTHDGALLIDNFATEDGSNETGGANEFAGFSEVEPCVGRGCGGSFLAPAPAISVVWPRGGEAVASFALRNLDASGYGAVSFRITSRRDGANDGRSRQSPVLRVRDEAGAVAEIDTWDLVEVPVLYPAFDQREVLQTVRVPFDRLSAANAELDLSRLASVEISLADDGDAGAVVITDVELGD